MIIVEKKHFCVAYVQYLEEKTREAEMKLSFRFLDHGVALAPGAAFYADEIGKFRIIFSTSRAELQEGKYL